MGTGPRLSWCYGIVYLVELKVSKYAWPAELELSPADTPSQAVSIRSVLVFPVCSERLTPSTSRRSEPAEPPVAGPDVQSQTLQILDSF